MSTNFPHPLAGSSDSIARLVIIDFGTVELSVFVNYNLLF